MACPMCGRLNPGENNQYKCRNSWCGYDYGKPVVVGLARLADQALAVACVMVMGLGLLACAYIGEWLPW